MKAFKIIALFSVIAMVALSGCVNIPVCGNEICEPGESATCPKDCSIKPCTNISMEEDDELDGLEGAGKYAGEEVTLILKGVIQEKEDYQGIREEKGYYLAVFTLVNEKHNKIDRKEAGLNAELNKVFDALATSVTVRGIEVDAETGIGLVTVELCDTEVPDKQT